MLRPSERSGEHTELHTWSSGSPCVSIVRIIFSLTFNDHDASAYRVLRGSASFRGPSASFLFLSSLSDC